MALGHNFRIHTHCMYGCCWEADFGKYSQTIVYLLILCNCWMCITFQHVHTCIYTRTQYGLI